ncbi:MAG TPA: hypothetical protein VET65_01750 [Candidatus Limnocylindrales bacterium]|nr:hypothetical protein [Candidatus Limnocylindrales bacterium]
MSVLVVLATFLAAGVEWVEALTIVLAVGMFKGWRSAFLGLAAALVALIALVTLFGFTVTSYVSIAAARAIVGVFLLLFGLKWLHKAILRSSGIKSLHDEAAAFEETRIHLVRQRGGAVAGALDWVGATTAFNGVFLEGLEVVFIVVALGGLHSLQAAAAGALASLVAVTVLGVGLRHPLTRIPENTMKYVVGIMLTAFGTFFAGEGIGVIWWRSDLVLLPLIVVYGLASILFVQILKNPPRFVASEIRALRAVRAVVKEVAGLFIDDGSLAVVAVAVLLAVAVFADRVGRGMTAGVLMVGGILLAVSISLSGVARQHRRTHKPPVAHPHPSAANEQEVAL